MSSSEEKRPEPAPRAIALRYERDGEAAPSLVAKGRGELAGRILELAERHGIPVRRDRDLLQLLSVCDLGDEIPPDLFGAVAELLAHFYRLNEELRSDATPKAD